MSDLADRIRRYTDRPFGRLAAQTEAIDEYMHTVEWPFPLVRPARDPAGDVVIILLDADTAWHWLALDRARLEHVARGGPHATRRDALDEAQDRVPSWSRVLVL